MKYIFKFENLGLSDVLDKGRTVREDLMKELKGARVKVSDVNWKRELETFRENPIDTAQTYFNQLNEAIRTKLAPEAVAKGSSKPAAKKPVAKKPAAKKPVAKKPAAKKRTTAKKKAVRQPRAKTATTRAASKKTTAKRTSTGKQSASSRTRKTTAKKAQ